VSTELWGVIETLLAPNPLSVGHVIARAVIIYIAAVAIMRIGDRRFFGHNAAFDVIFGVIIGSVFARGINGTARPNPRRRLDARHGCLIRVSATDRGS
jgi:hypothetical protein